MKTIFALSLILIAALTLGSCRKQQNDAEHQAEVDREVQRRLDAEHQVQEKEQLAQREAELNSREKALADKQKETTRTDARQTPRSSERGNTSQVRGTASYDTFYTKLGSFGDWIETSDYGYVFQPRQAEQSRNWRPYTNGHWVYTDAGWTWISNEQFGWATYHYGRWIRLHSVGWVWVPGGQWAPAWVSWRKGNDYV